MKQKYEGKDLQSLVEGNVRFAVEIE